MIKNNLNELGEAWSVRDAFIQLREITGSRQLIIKMIKTGQLKLYFKLKVADDAPLLIPRSFWENKGTSDFEFTGDNANKRYLVSIARLLPTLSPSFDVIEDVIEKRDASSITTNFVFYFWFQKFIVGEKAAIDWPALQIAFRAMRKAFLENTLKKVRVVAYSNNIEDCRKILLEELGKKPGRPRTASAAHFWLELIKALAIVKLGAGQESVIQHLNEWASKNKMSDKLGHSLVRKRVEEVWLVAGLGDKYRDQK